MKTSIIQYLIIACCVLITNQVTVAQQVASVTDEQAADYMHRLDIQESKSKAWLDELMTPGVSIEAGEMRFSEEAMKLMTNTTHRTSIYKETYGLLDLKQQMETGQLQATFWVMINLYPNMKEEMLEYLLAYDQAIASDEVLLNAFYTYAYFDPSIAKIENGIPHVFQPDLLEEKFRTTKEMITYIQYFRSHKPQ